MAKIKLNKKLAVGPVDLEVDRALLIESMNLNGLEWMMNKTIEELIELMDVLIHHRRQERTNEQVCIELADVFIQIATLVEMFGIKNIQHQIYQKQEGIAKRSAKLKKKADKVGF